MRLNDTVFELIENSNGLADQTTSLVFSSETSPFTATYDGPNITYGHAIVQGREMLYHAVNNKGEMSAGRAQVSFETAEDGAVMMILDWQWLTGDLSSGQSLWRQKR